MWKQKKDREKKENQTTLQRYMFKHLTALNLDESYTKINTIYNSSQSA